MPAQSRYLVEPNVKDGKGGLRDLHTLFWIGKYFYPGERPRSSSSKGVFTAPNTGCSPLRGLPLGGALPPAFPHRPAEERLTFDCSARSRAARLYRPRRPAAVERFMKHYFLIAKDVGDLTRIFCAALEDEAGEARAGAISRFFRPLRGARAPIGGTDFVIENGRINVADDTTSSSAIRST